MFQAVILGEGLSKFATPLDDCSFDDLRLPSLTLCGRRPTSVVCRPARRVRKHCAVSEDPLADYLWEGGAEESFDKHCAIRLRAAAASGFVCLTLPGR